MKYDNVKVFATATIPDGYFGATAKIGIGLVGHVVVAVHDYGYHTLAGVQRCASPHEVVYWLTNHPLKYPRITNFKAIESEIVDANNN